MWQLQWAIGLIPTSVLLWIYYVLLASGVVLLCAGWLIKWFPGIGAYKTPLQLLGIVLAAGSLYLLGGYGVEMAWRAKVAEAEEKVAKAEAESKELNKKLEEERKKKQKVRVEYYETIKTEIKEVEKQINADCKITPKVNELINKAATNPGAKK